jgi:DNA repair protein RadC
MSEQHAYCVQEKAPRCVSPKGSEARPVGRKTDGTLDQVPAYPREMVKQAVQLSASALIMLHNHSSCDPRPGQSDMDMTGAIRDAADVLALAVHHHLITDKTRESSFCSEGYL